MLQSIKIFWKKSKQYLTALWNRGRLLLAPGSIVFAFYHRVTADLKQIPNESLRFYGDPKNKSRTEDAIIAYTWKHYLEDPTKPEWLLRLPMTKAVVKAMDTVTDFVNKTLKREITNYCVGGASKVTVS